MYNRSVANCVTGPLLRFDPFFVSTYAALQAVYYYYYYGNFRSI